MPQINYLTGVVAPDPPRDEQGWFVLVPCVGDDISPLPPDVACETNHESTTCRVAFLIKCNSL